MKCDVCGTKIHVGQHECPNCGYKIKQVHTSVYDASGNNHEHIKSSQPKRFNYDSTLKETIRQTMNLTQNVQNKKLQSIIAIIIAVVVLGIVSVIAVPQFMNKQVNPYEYMSFEQVIEQGDDDGSIAMAVKREKELSSFMKEVGFQDIEMNESVSYYDKSIYASLSGNGYYNNILYRITLDFSQKTCFSQIVNISFETETSLREKQSLGIDKDFYNKVLSFIGIENGASLIESNLSHMEIDEESKDIRYEYGSKSDPYIYMSETYYNDSNTYNNYFSISKND
ncbi:MAG: hypothetical protein RR585_05510 [Coprobacillus sp.]